MSQQGKDRQGQIDAIVDAFVHTVRSGQETPPLEEVVRENPELAPELEQRLHFAMTLCAAFEESALAEATVAGIERIWCPHCGHQIALLEQSYNPVCRSCGSDFSTEAHPSMTPKGAFNDRFSLIREVGQGAFGIVYEAFDASLRRTVAVKIPRRGALGSTKDRQRFTREAQHAARLQHANIVQVYDTGTAEQPFIVAEFVKGLTLSDLMLGQRLSFRESVEIVCQVADALEYAHERKIIHRDVKPGNILIGDDGRPRLTDFGLARLTDPEISMTRDGEIIGTPAYMSPEQAAADHNRVGRKSDVYSLGVVLYRMLSGELPFRGSQRLLISQVLSDEAVSPRTHNVLIPKDLETITLKAMEKDPAGRYATARCFGDDLRRWLVGDPIRARPQGQIGRTIKLVRKYPLRASFILLISLLMMAVVLLSFSFARQQNLLRSVSEKSATQGRRQAASVLSQQGVYQAKSAGPLSGLPFFVEALAVLESEGAAEESTLVRQRIEETIRQSPQLTYVKGFGERVDSLCFDIQHGRLFVASGASIHVISASDWTKKGVLKCGSRIGSLHVTKNGTRLVAVPHAVGNSGSLNSAEGIPNAAWVWNTETLSPVAQLNHDDFVSGIDLSPDSRLIVTCSMDGTAKIWLASTGAFVKTVPAKDSEQTELANSVAFSADGRHVVVHSQTKNLPNSSALTVWDVKTWEAVPIPLGQYAWSNQFNKTRLLTAQADGLIREFDCVSGEATSLEMTHPGLLLGAAYVGDHIFSFSRQGHVMLWHAGTRQSVYGPLQTGTNGWLLKLSEDSSFFALPDDNGLVQVRWTATGRNVCPPFASGSEISALEIDRENRRVVTGGANGVVKVWDIASTAQSTCSLLFNGEPTSPQFSPDGRHFAFLIGGQVSVWETRTQQQVQRISVTDGQVVDFKFTADGSRFVGVTDSGEMYADELLTGTRIATLSSPGKLAGVFAVSQTEPAVVAIGYANGAVISWDAVSQSSASIAGFSDKITCLEFDPSGKHIFAATLSGDAQVINKNSKSSSPLLPHPSAVQSAQFSPNGQLLLTTCDPWVSVWDWQAGRMLHRHRKPIGSSNAVFDPTGNRFYSEGIDGDCCAWQFAPIADSTWARVNGLSFAQKFHRFALQKHGNLCLTSGSGLLNSTLKGRLQIWHKSSGVPAIPAIEFQDYVEAIFSPSGRYVLAASLDGSVRLVELSEATGTIEELRDFATATTGLRHQNAEMHSASPDEQERAFNSPNKSLRSITPLAVVAWQKCREHNLKQLSRLRPSNR